jgi:hypothetical protein
MSRVIALSAALCFVTAPAGYAQDEVHQALGGARDAYAAKNYTQAATQLQTALQLVNQLIVEELKAFLPKPSGAWKANDAEGSAAGMLLMAGLSASRHYYQDASEQTVDVEIVANSPLIATFRMMIMNPMMMAGEGKLVTLKGTQCIEKFQSESQSGELSCLPGSSTMVAVKGNSIASAEALRSFANQIDLAAVQRRFP